jgi:rhodanese-related sulfurtransferase
MAALLYDSLHEKLLKLPDDVEVWPAHGAGSACGRNISKETSSTIGMQRRMNYALQPMSRDEFVALLTTDMPDAPAYFPLDAEINRSGARPLSEIRADRMTTARAKREMHLGAIVLDVRDPDEYGPKHIPGSINIGLNGQFASWCGTLLSSSDRIIVAADDEREAGEAVMRLARVGLENVIGYILVGDWESNLDTIEQLSVSQLRDRNVRVLDVRRKSEYDKAHVPGATLIPLSELPRRIQEVRTSPLAVICGSGYRSSMAASLLSRSGLTDVANIRGGTSAWIAAGYATATESA